MYDEVGTLIDSTTAEMMVFTAAGSSTTVAVSSDSGATVSKVSLSKTTHGVWVNRQSDDVYEAEGSPAYTKPRSTIPQESTPEVTDGLFLLDSMLLNDNEVFL